MDLAEISHALIGLIPGAAGDAPRLAAVLRLSREVPRSELLETFGHPKPATTASKQYYVDSASYTAYYFADAVTLAILPERFVREVLGNVQTPLPTSREIEALVERSDREALFSVLFDVPLLREQADPHRWSACACSDETPIESLPPLSDPTIDRHCIVGAGGAILIGDLGELSADARRSYGRYAFALPEAGSCCPPQVRSTRCSRPFRWS